MGNSQTIFSIYPRYEFADVKGERCIVIPDVRNIDWPDLRYYSIDSAPDIFSRFSQVRTEKDLIKFVQQYGLVGIGRQKTGELPGRSITYVDPDPVNECLKEAATLRNLMELWNAPVMGELYLPGEKPFDIFENIIKPSINYLLPKGSDLDRSTLLKIHVAETVSKNISGLKPHIGVSPIGEIFPVFIYPSLLDAIWHQLYVAITGESALKRCPYCQSLHTARNKFCPAPPQDPPYKVSPCKDAFYRIKGRKWRSVIKPLLDAGNSPAEAARMSKTKLHLIKYWIDEEKGESK